MRVKIQVREYRARKYGFEESSWDDRGRTTFSVMRVKIVSRVFTRRTKKLILPLFRLFSHSSRRTEKAILPLFKMHMGE